jgi:hypothetical protein
VAYKDIATGTVTMTEPDSIEFTEMVEDGAGKVGITVRTVNRGDPDWAMVLESWAFRQGFVEE